MTLYAPHSRGKSLALIARRTCFSKHFLLTGGATLAIATFLAWQPEEGLAALTVDRDRTLERSAGDDALGAAHTTVALTDPEPSIAEPLSTMDAAPQAALPETGQWADLSESSDHVAEVEIAALAPAPTVDTNAGNPPDMQLRYASLVPPREAFEELNARLQLRMPEPAPVAIIPAKLPEAGPLDEALDLDVFSEEPTQIERFIGRDGELLEALLERVGVRADDVHATLVALRADDIPESLQDGDIVDLATEQIVLGGAEKRLLGMRFKLREGRELELRWDGEVHDLWARLDAIEDPTTEAAFEPLSVAETLGESILSAGESDKVYLRGEVRSTLFEAAAEAGMTPGEAETFAELFRYMIDFQRDLRAGDWFEVLFEKKPNGDYGDILYAAIDNRGERKVLFRAMTPEGVNGYFDENGKTNKRSLMRSPVAYARISSKYGMRMHPMLGYRKMHRGVDFAAPTGTPILAAGDGVIDYVGHRGAYGKYVRLRHSNGYKTAYAHMSRFVTNLRKGARVKQGEVIGYVGNTGRSTGPHLHFEVLTGGEQINPMSIADFGPLKGLEGRYLAEFKARVARIDLVLAELRPETRIAQANN